MNIIEPVLIGKSGIYMFINLVSGKRYVGSSKDIYSRLHEHMYNLLHNCHHNNHMQSSWNKYGEDAFIYGVLEFCDEDVRFDREQYYIDALRPEYNKTLNVIANTGITIPEDTRQKISETLKRKYLSGEILPQRNLDKWVVTYIYDITDWTLVKEFPCTKEALQFLGSKSSGAEFQSRIIKKRYVLCKTLFEYEEDLKNYIIPTYMKYRGNNKENKYLIVENEGLLNYYIDLTECAKAQNSSRSTLSKHIKATKENPYIIKQTKGKMYFGTDYIPLITKAHLLRNKEEKTLGNIEEIPNEGNIEINSEIA